MAHCSSFAPNPACVLPTASGPLLFITDLALEVMLQGRLYALYRGSRIVVTLMVFGYACEIAAMSTILSFLGADARSTSIRFLQVAHSRNHVLPIRK